MKVIPLTCALGAEIQGVNLAEAGRNADMAGEVKALLLKHKPSSIKAAAEGARRKVNPGTTLKELEAA